jgi:hypothetical protein
MRTISLRIWEVRASTGAFEHVVGYDAEIELIVGGTVVELELLSLLPGYLDPSVDEIRSALENIRTGIESVILPQGLGAYAVVSNLCIHPVDFIPRMFARYTQEKLREALVDAV